MDAHISIVVETESVRAGGQGPNTGNIWVVLGQEPFPMVGWNDFITVILDALASAVLRLVDGASRQEVVHFMEGPYELHLMRGAAGYLRMTARIRGKGAKASLVVSERRLVAAVHEAADVLLDACRKQGCWSIEADRLAVSSAALRVAEGPPQL